MHETSSNNHNIQVTQLQKATPPPPYSDSDDPEPAWPLECEELPRSVVCRRRYLHAAAALLLFSFVFVSVTYDEIKHLVGAVSHIVYDALPAKQPAVDKFAQESCIRYADWAFDVAPRSHPGNHSHAARASFDLRVDSHLLYFVSRGAPSLLKGSIEVLDSGVAGADVAAVDVVALYDSPDDFALTQTCWLRPQFNSKESKVKNGLGIYGPEKWEEPEGAHRMSFHIKVRLPRRENGDMILRTFRTDLPMFSHHIGDLQDHFSFEQLKLNGEGRPILVESFKGAVGRFTNAHSEIAGTFRAWRSLHLEGVDTSIKTNVTLHSADSDKAAQLSLQSTEREIESTITLLSPHQRDGMFGAFVIDAATTGSPVHLSFPAAPLHSELRLTGRTTRAPIRAEMHETFEGAFRLYNDGVRPPSVSSSRADDPARLRRHRDVAIYRSEDSAVEGSATWAPPMLFENRQGSVELSTTGGECELRL